MGDVLIIQDFPDVFPDDLQGVPSERQVEFWKNLIPGVALIAKVLYRLVTSKTHELSATAEVVRQGIHQAEQFTMGSTDPICKEEGWFAHDVN